MFSNRMSCLIASVVAVTALLLAVHPASAQPMPPGGSKLYPWNVMGYQGYREPPQATKPKDPNAAPVAPTKYQVAITIVVPQSIDEYYASRAMMMAHLPENAQIWFEDKETTSKGPMREFVSPVLKPGKNFVYTVRIDWVEDGQKVTQTHEFNVKAGAIHCIYLVRNDSTDADIVIDENLKKLSAEDRKLAEAQKFCPIQETNRLGIMGVPVKVMVNGQPVFLCCEACTRRALKSPDQTLAKVKELKEKKSAPPKE